MVEEILAFSVPVNEKHCLLHKDKREENGPSEGLEFGVLFVCKG